jgi:hypothetical protein
MLPAPDEAKAKANFEHAIATARVQHAKSWELRAAMNMARLWRDQGKRQQARDLLAPVYGWFTEGFSTANLQIRWIMCGRVIQSSAPIRLAIFEGTNRLGPLLRTPRRLLTAGRSLQLDAVALGISQVNRRASALGTIA